MNSRMTRIEANAVNPAFRLAFWLLLAASTLFIVLSPPYMPELVVSSFTWSGEAKSQPWSKWFHAAAMLAVFVVLPTQATRLMSELIALSGLMSVPLAKWSSQLRDRSSMPCELEATVRWASLSTVAYGMVVQAAVVHANLSAPAQLHPSFNAVLFALGIALASGFGFTLMHQLDKLGKPGKVGCGKPGLNDHGKSR
jgi:hypothetical protein